MNFGTEFAKKIEDMVRENFPNSYIKVKWENNLTSSITLWFALGKDKSVWTNGIIQNDPAYSLMFIWGFDRDGEISPKGLTLDGNVGLRDKATYKIDKLGWRNIKAPTQDPEKIFKTIEKWFLKLKSEAEKRGY